MNGHAAFGLEPIAAYALKLRFNIIKSQSTNLHAVHSLQRHEAGCMFFSHSASVGTVFDDAGGGGGGGGNVINIFGMVVLVVCCLFSFA